MQHLSVDRLGALADEEPTADEAAHLASCIDCAREREAYRAVLAMAVMERGYAGAPLTTWESLAPRLREEGLIGGRRARVFSFPSSRKWLEAAAAVVLIGGGAIIGRYSAGATPLPTPVATIDQSVGDATPVLAASSGRAFTSSAEAVAALSRAQQDVQKALAYLSSQDTSANTVDKSSMYRNRLAALDEVASTTREAVNEAPYDPVMNGYYLTTMQAREATLRQLNTTLPSGVKLTRF